MKWIRNSSRAWHPTPSKVQANRPNWRAPTNAHASATFPLWRVVKRVAIVEKGRRPPVAIQTILVPSVLVAMYFARSVRLLSSRGNGLVSVTAQIIVTAREKRSDGDETLKLFGEVSAPSKEQCHGDFHPSCGSTMRPLQTQYARFGDKRVIPELQSNALFIPHSGMPPPRVRLREKEMPGKTNCATSSCKPCS